MAGIDPFANLTAAMIDLLTRDGDLFLALGTNLFRGLAVILVAWFGIRTALRSAEGRAPFPLGQFGALLLTIAFGFTMMTYYRAPIPGIGLSFTQLVTDQPIFLARQLEVTQVQRLSDRLNQLYLAMEQPSVFNVSAIVAYFLVALAVTAARVVLLAVIAFGLVATGVAVLVGPVFIPFFLVPQLDWLFWGWLKSLLQYAFYQVIAQAFVFVFGSFLINFLDAFPPPYTVDRLLVGGFHLVFLLCAFTYGLLKVPSLTHSLFSGGGGESALPVRFQ
ncbi:MAG TPA: type IV secretion system protein [Vicinamibacterales bacterium]|nr:type IV secretion system protein [Vicinamibacterales bacterium]